MSNNNDQTDPKNGDESEGIKNLRAKAEQTDTQTARADAAERKLAFVEAGIPLSSKPAQGFMQTYSGDMTPEAIKAEAIEWGLIQAEGTQQSEQFGEGSDERTQQQLRDGLEGGAAGDEPPQLGGVDQALNNFKNNRAKGMGAKPATNLAFGEVIKAAATGDRQAIFNPEEWAKKQAQHGHGAEFAR